MSRRGISIRAERGSPFGAHRAGGGLPQPADRLNADPMLWRNEMLIDVEGLLLDSSSMRQIATSAGGEDAAIKARIREIVAARGKMHNPVTNSGGVALGRVAIIGPEFPARGLKSGDLICTLVSLSLTPLAIDSIESVDPRTGSVRCRGQAVLFETGLCARIPDDIPAETAVALCDIAGAPATLLRLVEPGMTVAVLGAAGKAGVASLFAARRRLGTSGRLIALDVSESGASVLRNLDVADEVLTVDLRDPLAAHEAMAAATGGRLADLAINTTNVAGTEGAAILSTRQRGRIVFFSMATSFQAAALGAEGLGRDVEMLIGNGYLEGWVDSTFDLVRAEPRLLSFFADRYAGSR